MTLTMMEGAVEAVKDYLSANMGAKLDALDSEYDDGITLTDIVTFYTNEVRAIPASPSIFVLGEYTEVDSEQAQVWMQTSHIISIVVVVGDNVLETLRTRIYRHVRAAIELLIAARSSDGWNRIIRFGRISFAPIYTQAGTFLADATIEISVALNESV